MLSSFSYTFISNIANLKMFACVSNNKSFVSQSLKVVGPLGGKFNFSVPRDLKFKGILIIEPQNSSSILSEL